MSVPDMPKEIELAARLFNLGFKHSEPKLFSDYVEILNEIRSLLNDKQVEFLLHIANLIDSYSYQYPPKKST